MRALARPVLALVVLAGCLGHRDTFDTSAIRGEPVRVTQADDEEEDASLVRARDGRFHIVWWAKRRGQVDLFVRSSPDGLAWGDEHQITNDADEDYYPALLQVRDGTFHLVWFRTAGKEGRKDLWYARSPDAVHWTAPTRLTQTGLEWAPAIYEDGFHVLWIVWSSSRTGNRELFAMRSGDAGHTWSVPFRLTDSPEEDDFPHVLVLANGDRMLTWTRYRAGSRLGDYYRDGSAEVVTATSHDGLRWSAPVVVSPPDPEARFVDILPVLFADAGGQRIFVAWTSSRAGFLGDVLVRELTQSPGSVRQLTTSWGSDYGGKVVAAGDAGEYVLAWTASRLLGSAHVFTRRFRL
jgi:hypothetical protein